MATRFVQEAKATLNPLFAQQTKATQAQIPAIQKLYESLTQGLESQGATQRQNILEDAAARGVSRSTLPVDLQTALGQSLLQERGKLGAQQASDIAGVRKGIADIGLNRVTSIYDLAGALQGADLKEREFKMQQQQAEREYQLKLQEIAASRASNAGAEGGRKLADSTLKALAKGADVDSIIDRIANAGGTQADIDFALGITASAAKAKSKAIKKPSGKPVLKSVGNTLQGSFANPSGFYSMRGNLPTFRPVGGLVDYTRAGVSGLVRGLFGG